MFFKADNIKEEVEKYVSAPQLFKVSEKYLDDASKEESQINNI